jgi:peptidoglycan lytic transglycosylase G
VELEELVDGKEGQRRVPAGPSPRRPRRRGRRRVAWSLALGVLAGLVLAAWWAALPPPALRTGPRTLEIPAQQGVVEVAERLAEADVIRSRAAFVTLAVIRGTARSLRAGEYEVPQGASLLATLKLLESGKVKPHLVVMPEGFTVRELARRLEAEGLASAGDVLRMASSPFFVQSLGIEAESVEGYLHPDTYQVTKGMRVEEILGRMANRFKNKVATPEIVAEARGRGLTLHQLLTFASIIEKEAVLPEERPVIAAVFWNRLRRDMLLQADPTVAYAVGKDGRAPTRADLLVDSPFNTYRYRGLPPGPIGNPGLAAVQAVLRPAPVPYLYFVAVDERQHHFSQSLPEHLQAVARYRQSRARSSAL